MYIITSKTNDPIKIKVVQNNKEDTVQLSTIGQTVVTDELTDKIKYLESKGVVSSALMTIPPKVVAPEPEVVNTPTEEVVSESDEDENSQGTEDTSSPKRRRRSSNKEESELKEE